MNKIILVALSLLTSKALAMEPMEMTVNNEATSLDSVEKKIVIPIQDQKKELPARFIPLFSNVADLIVADDLVADDHLALLGNSPMMGISIDTWQLIEDQLERIYSLSQGNWSAENEILAAYRELDSPGLIKLICAVHFLGIPFLESILIQLAQSKLTHDEILGLPEIIRNEVIKGIALTVAGPMPLESAPLDDLFVYTEDGYWEWWLCSRVMDEHDANSQQGLYLNWYTLVCISPSGKIIFKDIEEGGLSIHDIDGKKLAVCKLGNTTDNDDVRNLSISAFFGVYQGKEQEMIVTGTNSGYVYLYDSNGKNLASYNCGWPIDQENAHVDEEGFPSLPDINSVSFVAPNKLVIGSCDGLVIIRDLNNETLPIVLTFAQMISPITITAAGKIVFGAGNTLYLYNLDGTLHDTLRGHDKQITVITSGFDRTGQPMIISGSVDGTVRIWGQQDPIVCKGGEAMVTSIFLTKDLKIISGSSDHSTRIWDIHGKLIASYKDHYPSDYANGLVLSKAKSDDDIIRIRDIEGKELAYCSTSYDYTWIDSANFTPDGQIVSSSFEVIDVWDLPGYLSRFRQMNAKQAEVICKMLQTWPCTNQDEREKCWEEIWKVLENTLPTDKNEEETSIEKRLIEEAEGEGNPPKKMRLSDDADNP